MKKNVAGIQPIPTKKIRGEEESRAPVSPLTKWTKLIKITAYGKGAWNKVLRAFVAFLGK